MVSRTTKEVQFCGLKVSRNFSVVIRGLTQSDGGKLLQEKTKSP
jgi:hypothetical protein